VPELPTASPTPYTLEGFQKDYDEMVKSFGDNNVSEKTIRSVYEADLLRKKLMDDITKDLPKTEEQVWARHILLESETEAETTLRLLQQGLDFAQLAKTNSKDTGSGANGGDLGWFGKGAMVPEFEEAAYSLDIGEISEPIKSDFGYHIIQVLGRQELPLDANQYEQKKQKVLDDWLAAAREEATITTFEAWRERVPAEPSLQPQ
jgi:foldase protein PrsA